MHRAISHRLHKNISVIALKPQGLVYLFYMKFGRSGVFTAGNDIGDFLQAAMAKDDIARPRKNSVVLTVTLQSPLKLRTEDLVRRIGQADYFFRERMQSPEARAAFQSFFLRKKK